MKKKLLALLLSVCLCVPLVGCGENEKAVDNTQPKVTTEEQQTQKPEEQEEVTQEQAEGGREGINLINSIGTDRPSTLRIVSEVTTLGSTITMTTYYDGDKSKTEIDVPGMSKSILIHIPNKEIMYQYVYGESTGIKITGADKSSAEEMGMMMDTSILTDLLNNSSDDIIARMEYLEEFNGEEVVYIESTESDEDVGEMLVKMWYSEKYATPLKYEVYAGGTLMTELKVTKISDNVNFNADTFMPPADIQFQEIDMATMMEME